MQWRKSFAETHGNEKSEKFDKFEINQVSALNTSLAWLLSTPPWILFSISRLILAHWQHSCIFNLGWSFPTSTDQNCNCRQTTGRYSFSHCLINGARSKVGSTFVRLCTWTRCAYCSLTIRSSTPTKRHWSIWQDRLCSTCPAHQWQFIQRKTSYSHKNIVTTPGELRLSLYL